LRVPIYNEGITGKTINNEIYKLIELEDTNHQIKFFTFHKDVHLLNIPRDHLLYSDGTLPYWTDWKMYTDFDRAFSISEKFYNWTLFQQLLQPNSPSCFEESEKCSKVHS